MHCYGPSLGVPQEALAGQLAVERRRLDPPGTLIRFTGRIGGTLAGTAALLGRHGVAGLYVITVRPEFRRRGIGTALMTFVLNEGTRLGAHRATLEVRRSNEAARQLYERLGFLAAGVRRAYYTNPIEDALVLWRERLKE